MKSAVRPTFGSVALTFVIALVFYVVAYSWMTRKQTGRGPWLVTFTNLTSGDPAIIINQPVLGISNVTIAFSGEINAATNTATVAFGKPRTHVPFGNVIFDDLMFLPGTITLNIYGHEVEMVPRTLGLNQKPVPWQPNAVHHLAPADKLPLDLRRKPKPGYATN